MSIVAAIFLFDFQANFKLGEKGKPKMLMYALRALLVVISISIGVVLLTGGLLVATLNSVSLLADSDLVSGPTAAIATVLVIIFSMTLLAPVFEWWFKVWRTVDNWLQERLSKD